ncbi:MAG: c-type cytochrome [Myxococcales bacterium]|nr:MAG: c-type cytochrome [Myxococcales bacterium]
MSEVRRTDEIQGDIIHEYDGIEEADNRLPNWWLATFYIAVIFAIGYWFYYQVYESGLQPLAAYQAKIAENSNAPKEEVSAEMLNSMSADAAAVEAGKAVFVANCVACHLDKGQGNIGPNLTDAYWIHGGAATDIYKIVDQGFAAKGMPAWGPVLGAEKAKQVVAFVLTLRNTNVPGKAPEGEEWKEGGAESAPEEQTVEETDSSANEGAKAPAASDTAKLENKDEKPSSAATPDAVEAKAVN